MPADDESLETAGLLACAADIVDRGFVSAAAAAAAVGETHGLATYPFREDLDYADSLEHQQVPPHHCTVADGREVGPFDLHRW